MSALSPNQIMAAYEKHGENFVIIERSEKRSLDGKFPTDYYKTYILCEDGSKVLAGLAMNLVPVGAVDPPEKRSYDPRIKVQYDAVDKHGEPFGKALKTFEECWAAAAKKMAEDKTYHPVRTPNVNMFHAEQFKKPDGTYASMDRPMLYIKVNKKSQKEPDRLRYDVKYGDPATRQITGHWEGVSINYSNLHEVIKSGAKLTTNIDMSDTSFTSSQGYSNSRQITNTLVKLAVRGGVNRIITAEDRADLFDEDTYEGLDMSSVSNAVPPAVASNASASGADAAMPFTME